MADAPDANAASEPSMEEILASIRKIIADEKEPVPTAEAPPNGEDVLELTQLVQDDGSVVDIAASAPPPTPAKEPVMPPPDDQSPKPAPEPAPPAKAKADEGLVSAKTAVAASSSMAALASTVNIERLAATSSSTLLGNGGRTLEEMVMELMKPMLKEWLDQNLPAVVDRLVQKEIERIAHKAQQ